MGRFGDRLAKSKRPGSGLPPMRYRTSSVMRRASTRAQTSARRLESRRTRHGFSRATGGRASSPWTNWRIFHGFVIPQRQGGNLGLRRLAKGGWLRQIVPVRVFEPAGQNVPQMIGQIVDSHSKAVNIQGLKTSDPSGMPSASYLGRFWNRVAVDRFNCRSVRGS